MSGKGVKMPMDARAMAILQKTASVARGSGSPGMVIAPMREARYQAKRIEEAMDPAQAPGPVRTWKDMTPEERAEMVRLYSKGPA